MYKKKYINLYLNKKYKLFILNKTTSTNHIIKNDNYDDYSILIAKRQTSGVGRTGKFFESSKKRGLYMSIKYSEDYLKDITNITCMVAVAVCNALEKQIKEKLFIKWVNDIYLNSKKICGILVEKHNDKYIIGIGINLYSQKFNEELSKIASSIEDLLNIKLDINKLVVDIIDEIEQIIISNNSYMDEYIERSFIIGRKVIVVQNNLEYEVMVKSINLNGNLVVIHDDREETINSGEVTKIVI